MSNRKPSEKPSELLPKAQDALDRMARAHRRGTGCHLTAEMIEELSHTKIGGLWEQDRHEDYTNDH